MLAYLLYGIFILACIVLVISVLLQPGKADAGALFTSSVSSTAFGPRGTQSVLAKITIAAAITFMLTALILSMGIGNPRSVMEGGGATTPQATPAAPATPQTDGAPAAPQTEGAAPVAPAANTNTAATTPAPAASPAAQTSPAR
ncbi:MAG TPA: preprotein translocase subunit SecG [Pyrinomonadaceae bacterium]|nr:preprotein translocase subunit SecG [Pyrinomonadaceae bacterium]